MPHDDLPSTGHRPEYAPGFRARRGLNWGFIGLLYTSFYMCRYNFPLANKAIATQYGFNTEQMGWIITATLLAYACGQIINGLLTDRIGGKKAMLIGATGTIVANIAFGAASFVGSLALFTTVWGINGYLQSFGAPGMVKMNAAWFPRSERGRFAGIFGFMINLGRILIGFLGPALIAGSMFFGALRFTPLNWRWLFFAPSMICAVVAIGMAIFVKQTPEECGFEVPHEGDIGGGDGVTASVRTTLVTILSNPGVWITACAYACTGAVRQSVDQWFPRYMQDLFGTDQNSTNFKLLLAGIAFVASLGSMASGYISDLFFQSRRAPVAGALYIIETCVILLAAQFHSAAAAFTFFVLISFTANSTHSLLGTAAAMDMGGRKMSGFSSGVIDSFQYFGGSLAGFMLGAFIHRVGWGSYFYFMAPFGVIGAVLMFVAGHLIAVRGKPAPGFDVVPPTGDGPG